MSLLIAFNAIGLARSQDGAPVPDPREQVVRLKEQLKLYRDIRAQHQRDDFFRVSREDAVRLEEAGLDDLRRFDAAKAALTVLGAAPEAVRLRLEGTLGVDKMPKDQAEAVRASIKTYIDERLGGGHIKAGGRAKDAIEIAGKLAERRAEGKLDAADVDNAILAIKTFELALKTGTEQLNKIPGGAVGGAKMVEQANLAVEIAATSARGLLYATKAMDAKTQRERDEARTEALKETAALLAAVSKLSLSNATMALGANAKLAAVNFDVYSRLLYWGMAQKAASGLRNQASEIQGEAINQLNYKILVTQYELDKAERTVRIAERRAGRPLREPGGIKLNNMAADAIAARLDIEAVSFDAVSGKVILEGKSGRHIFDLDVLQTVLRLAAEVNEPFFSLEMVNPVEYDGILTDFSHRIHDKYQRGGNEQLARRIAAVGLRMPLRDGRECYFADLARVDPELHREALAANDFRQEKVFSPEWLRYTRVGQILYEADIHIKSIVTGFREADGQLRLADVWDIPGFVPSFLTQPISGGRANLELDASDVLATHGRVDLAAVRPKLVYVARKPGTTEDLPPTPEHRRVVAHFDQNWRAYAERVPALTDLMTVYRAYVAARRLVQKQPRLKQQIIDLGEPGALDVWPLYVSPPMAAAGCVSNGKLVPLSADGPLIIYGGALSGGTAFRFAKKIAFVEDMRSGDDQPFPLGDLRGRSGIVERGGHTAVIIDFDSFPLPIDQQWRALWVCLAAAFAFGTLLFALRRLFPPHPAAQALCLHCVVLHRRLELFASLADLFAAGAVAFIVLVPFLAAQHSTEPTWRELLTGAGIVGGVLLAATASGYLGHAVLRRFRRVPEPLVGPVRWLGAGNRWTGLALAAFLLSGGMSEAAVAERLVGINLNVGSRLLQSVGNLEVVRFSLLVVISAALASVFLRWIAPYFLGSRPLLLGLHSHERAPAT